MNKNLLFIIALFSATMVTNNFCMNKNFEESTAQLPKKLQDDMQRGGVAEVYHAPKIAGC